MKIFQVLNHFLPQQIAGTEVYTWALSKQLQQKNFDVEIIIPHYNKKENDSYTYDGLNVFQYAEPSVVDRSLIMGKRKPEGLKTFENYLQKEKPDIVHFHELAGSNGISLNHVIAAKAVGAKVIMTFHLAGYSCKTGTLVYNEMNLCDGFINIKKCSSCYLNSKGYDGIKPILLPASMLLNKLQIDTTNWNNKMGTALGTTFLIKQLKNNLELLVQLCDKVVVLTNWYKKILLLNGVLEEKICLVQQGLPFEPILKSVVEKLNAKTTLRLMFLGRIDPLKGLHLCIDALADLAEDKIELDIYGQQVNENYEKELRMKTQYKQNIHWKGSLQQRDVVVTMQQYDALCLCSYYEMSPLVIQEAFAAGIPVIASNVYGNAEQIKHDVNGLLFRFKDAASLKEQFIRCINDSTLLPQLKNNIKAPRSFDEVGNENYQLYKSLLK